MTELHKVMKKYLEINNCYPCNTFWEKQIREAIESDEKSSQLEPPVKPDACGGWQKEKPNKPCYFVHRYNRKDNNPSLFEAVMDGGVLVVANIQDDEFVETMEDFADGDFFIIEKY